MKSRLHTRAARTPEMLAQAWTEVRTSITPVTRVTGSLTAGTVPLPTEICYQLSVQPYSSSRRYKVLRSIFRMSARHFFLVPSGQCHSREQYLPLDVGQRPLAQEGGP